VPEKTMVYGRYNELVHGVILINKLNENFRILNGAALVPYFWPYLGYSLKFRPKK